MANPFEFLQQVRSETAKVVWPSRRETLITTGMVMLMPWRLNRSFRSAAQSRNSESRT